MTMKQIAYWIMTLLIALETFAGGVMDLTHGLTEVVGGTSVAQVVSSLGYPEYILTILGVWKVLGSVVIVLPRLPRLKEWAYAGIIFELTGATISQLVRHQGVRDIATPAIMAVIALLSWGLRPPNRSLQS